MLSILIDYNHNDIGYSYGQKVNVSSQFDLIIYIKCNNRIFVKQLVTGS
jgi:hypothetical protein